ncbi:MAG: hypothetical protein WKG32_13165 [Gemmatimonadaceae bacterium]
MKQTPKAPAPSNALEPSPLERMRELTRRIVNVPKSELPTKKQPPKKRRG